MTSVIQAPPDTTSDQPACDCPTITKPGTIQDRITTIHRPSCPFTTSLHLGTRARVEAIHYAPGTLNRRLDDAFGPVTA